MIAPIWHDSPVCHIVDFIDVVLYDALVRVVQFFFFLRMLIATFYILCVATLTRRSISVTRIMNVLIFVLPGILGRHINYKAISFYAAIFK